MPLTTTGTGTDDDEALDVPPVERRVEQVDARPDGTGVDRVAHRGQRVVLKGPVDPPLAIAHSDHRQVDGEEHGREPRFERLRDQLVGDPVIPEDVDLQEADAVGRGARNLLRARRGEGGEADRRPGRRGCPRHPLLTVRMSQALVRNRRHDDGEPTSCPSTVVAVVTASIPHNTRWRSRQRAEGFDVVPQRPLGACTAAEELGPVGIHAGDGERLDVGQRERRLHRVTLQRAGDESSTATACFR